MNDSEADRKAIDAYRANIRSAEVSGLKLAEAMFRLADSLRRLAKLSPPPKPETWRDRPPML